MPITNPILPGFNPDPSICRVGDDYYIATSTFEWYPGVQIHHSRDLIHWRLLTRPLAEARLLDMTGNGPNDGVWAPCLSYDNGIFYLVYSDTKCRRGRFNDIDNYLITATDIAGPWADPVYLNSSGIDPSLFHNHDGKKYLLTPQFVPWQTDVRGKFFGINLQEYDPGLQQLIGTPTQIFDGTDLGITEGPHLYQRDGWYYLVCAEGGTSYRHAVTVARARTIEGPYEVHPENPMICALSHADAPFHKTGHASFVETQQGAWYVALLGSRPIGENRRCTLGRETLLEQLVWGEDGWPRLAHGGTMVRKTVPAPDLPAHPWPVAPETDDFDTTTLGSDWQWLRRPDTKEWLSLHERPGWLRLRGRHSFYSLHKQSLVARRIQSFRTEATTKLEFFPEDSLQTAGMMLRYDEDGFFYAAIGLAKDGTRCLRLLYSEYETLEPLIEPIALPATGAVWLRMETNDTIARAFYSLDGSAWTQLGKDLDATLISDDYFQDWGCMRFTGSFYALCCQDKRSNTQPADFDFFTYKELDRE